MREGPSFPNNSFQVTTSAHYCLQIFPENWWKYCIEIGTRPIITGKCTNLWVLHQNLSKYVVHLSPLELPHWWSVVILMPWTRWYDLSWRFNAFLMNSTPEKIVLNHTDYNKVSWIKQGQFQPFSEVILSFPCKYYCPWWSEVIVF